MQTAKYHDFARQTLGFDKTQNPHGKCKDILIFLKTKVIPIDLESYYLYKLGSSESILEFFQPACPALGAYFPV